MRTPIFASILLLSLLFTPRAAGAQPGPEAQARALERQAIASATEGSPAALQRAARLWRQTADAYTQAGLPLRAAAAWDSASHTYDRLAARDSALASAGRALAIRDTSLTAQVDSLLNASPLLRPTRSVAEEERFVRGVRQLLARIRGRPTSPAEVPHAEAAVAALEALNAGRETVIDVSTPFPSFDFRFRRWLYRNSRSAATWQSRTAAARFLAPRVTYQFRYIDPRTGRDTTVTRACADSPCIIRLPVSPPRRTP
jgi:hypothetical protein